MPGPRTQQVVLEPGQLGSGEREARCLAILGLGPWGLTVLDRIISRVERDGDCQPVSVHVVEPGCPGPGIYSDDTPDYLLMNTPCDQVSMFAGDALDGRRREPSLSLYEWADRRGYRWLEGSCRVSPRGERLSPNDFLPRRVAGEYLSWYYGHLVKHLPDGLSVLWHRATAVGVRPGPRSETVVLDDGETLCVDRVFITTGHTSNRGWTDVRGVEPGAAGGLEIPAYPVDRYANGLVPGESVGVSGMGLAAIDAIMALTLGRGGRFQRDAKGRLAYVRSGREPEVYLYSRSDLPYLSRPAVSTDLTGSYEPCICTDDNVTDLLGAQGAGRVPGPARGSGSSDAGLDIERDFLPLVFAEMNVAFFAARARTEGGIDAARAVRQRLRTAWRTGTFRAAKEECELRFGGFDAERTFFAPLPTSFASGEEYQSAVVGMVEEDLHAATTRGSSPLKEAYEMLRVLRDTIRRVVDFYDAGRASSERFRRFVATRINRLVVGPPALRTEQLVALIEAGVVRAILGPNPEVRADGQGASVRLSSRSLEKETTVHVRRVIRGRVEEPKVHRSRSPLLSSLFREGRVAHRGDLDTGEGPVLLTRDLHPISRGGRVEERLWLLGPLTEGTRYFMHYIPSPKSRLQAFRDAEGCVATALSGTAARTGRSTPS